VSRERFSVAVVGLGALGSATAWQLARRGVDVVGLEQFELGHERGASHDSSRIIRHSYHSADYVRLTFEAYQDWATLESDAGESFVTVTGGLDLYPAAAAIPPADYLAAMDACAVAYEIVEPDELTRRWPQLALPAGTLAVYQERTGIVPAARGTAAMQAQALARGATLRDRSPVTAIRPLPSGEFEVDAGDDEYVVSRLVITADAWTNIVLANLDVQIPLTVTQEQVTYFAPDDADAFAANRFPVWIWMDDPSYYGFPCYGEPTIKAAQDCGGPQVTSDARSFEPDVERRARLAEFMALTLPGSGRPVRSKTCLYTLTPDRDFVLGPVPGHPGATVGLGAAHGFKFAPTFGRLLADYSTGAEPGTAVDLTPFRLDRPALTDADYPVSWLV
jgi:sarcosine oxidase